MPCSARNSAPVLSRRRSCSATLGTDLVLFMARPYQTIKAVSSGFILHAILDIGTQCSLSYNLFTTQKLPKID
jgi:hypothetical protein